ncbi:MAG TPA: hypothetical protein VFN51_01550 [Candidatus Saccharimonadales bacterium]|nr:hypothetical protein [Candidatus Saccharimonadales bacterium]
MGLFGKIKENFNHGGIKIQLQAPASVSMNDATLPVSVNVSATSEPHNIESVSVAIIAQPANQAFTDPNNVNSVQNFQETVARSDINQPFSLQPGESKTIEFTIVMNAGAAAASQLPAGSSMAEVAGVFQKLQSVSEVMDRSIYEYYIEASAKVEGIGFSPSFQQPIQLFKPGEIGTGFNGNIHL